MNINFSCVDIPIIEHNYDNLILFILYDVNLCLAHHLLVVLVPKTLIVLYYYLLVAITGITIHLWHIYHHVYPSRSITLQIHLLIAIDGKWYDNSKTLESYYYTSINIRSTYDASKVNHDCHGYDGGKFFSDNEFSTIKMMDSPTPVMVQSVVLYQNIFQVITVEKWNKWLHPLVQPLPSDCLSNFGLTTVCNIIILNATNMPFYTNSFAQAGTAFSMWGWRTDVYI